VSVAPSSGYLAGSVAGGVTSAGSFPPDGVVGATAPKGGPAEGRGAVSMRSR
jgi:hypothetical protein